MGCGGSAASHYAARPDAFGPVSTASSQSSGKVPTHSLVSKRPHWEIGGGTAAAGGGELRSLSFEDFEEPESFGVDATSAVLSLKKGETVFVKRLSKGRDRWGELTEACQHEVHMLKTLSGCPGVIALHGTMDSPSELWTVFEFCDGGDLQSWLTRFPSTARSVARQLLEAVKHLHAKRVCHRNVRPSNVLLTNSGRLRLSGFTRAHVLVEDGQLKGICGSDGFRAPEVTRDGSYCGLSADIFSLGRTLETLARIDMRWRELAHVCLDMTSPNPLHRPDIEAVYAALFGGGQWSMTMTPGVPFLQLPQQLSGENRVTPKWGSSPELRSKQPKSEQLQSPDGPSNEVMLQPTTPGAKAARQSRKGHRRKIISESKTHAGGEGKSYASEPSPDELQLACSSAFCIRMGTCFCHDKLPAMRKACGDSQGAPRAMDSPRFSEHDRRTPVARSIHGSLELLE